MQTLGLTSGTQTKKYQLGTNSTKGMLECQNKTGTTQWIPCQSHKSFNVLLQKHTNIPKM
jgi:hypothetical protein